MADDGTIDEETDYISLALAEGEERPNFYSFMQMVLAGENAATEAGRVVDYTSIQVDWDTENERWMLSVSLEPNGF